ncbi:MAG: FHA domain-containing protein [Candidatus Promineifilaceae bacterium]
MLRRQALYLYILPTLFLLGVISAIPTFAQGDNYRVRLSPPDATEFPKISFNLIALDSDLNVIKDMSGIEITEDGLIISDIFSETVKVGTEVIFVIDANTDIEERDETGGPSRREKVRDSIVRFVDQYMDPENLDRISIIVPDEQSGRFLDEPGMVFHNTVKNAVNFYMPAELGETPLNNMLEMALQQAEMGGDEGRVPAIVLFSDSGQLNEQLDFDGLVEQSLSSQAVFYAAILGSSADPWEIDDVQRLTGPSGGSYVHMPQIDDADPLYNLIKDRAATTQFMYQSSLKTSGQHTIAAELAGGRGEVAFDLVVAPPAVSLALDNTRPILRVAQEATTPLEEVEPMIQPLAAQVSWPDGHPRELSAASLLVDGMPRPLRTPVLDGSGLLTFDWDIRDLDSGLYAVQVQVEDEQGLIGVSAPIPLAIVVERPVLQLTATPLPSPTPMPTPVPVPTPTPEPPALMDLARENALFLGGGAALILLIFVIIVTVTLLIRAGRKKRKDSRAGGELSADSSAGGRPESDPTYAIMPGFASSQSTGAFLEAVENAPEHVNLIPISGNNVALGRDPKVSQISFNDRSVSRLHARILESHGSYRIYDEGSTSGTYVNYQRIGLTPRVLSNRDEVHVGRVHLRFHLVLPPGEQDDKVETA